MNDAYDKFLSRFNISVDELIDLGLKETVFPDADLVDKAWSECKRRLDRKEVHWIRGYGRDAAGTNLYKRFYELLLGIQVSKDPNNNYQPRKILVRTTPGGGAHLTNYQVSHVFGRTKNPILSTAPWNIVWKPKVLDPFTGHETTGHIRESYFKAYHQHVKERYRKYIDEYETLREIYFKPDVIAESLNAMHNEGQFTSIEGKRRFKASVDDELGTLQQTPSSVPLQDNE